MYVWLRPLLTDVTEKETITSLKIDRRASSLALEQMQLDTS